MAQRQQSSGAMQEPLSVVPLPFRERAVDGLDEADVSEASSWDMGDEQLLSFVRSVGPDGLPLATDGMSDGPPIVGNVTEAEATSTTIARVGTVLIGTIWREAILGIVTPVVNAALAPVREAVESAQNATNRLTDMANQLAGARAELRAARAETAAIRDQVAAMNARLHDMNVAIANIGVRPAPERQQATPGQVATAPGSRPAVDTTGWTVEDWRLHISIGTVNRRLARAAGVVV